MQFFASLNRSILELELHKDKEEREETKRESLPPGKKNTGGISKIREITVEIAHDSCRLYPLRTTGRTRKIAIQESFANWGLRKARPMEKANKPTAISALKYP